MGKEQMIRWNEVFLKKKWGEYGFHELYEYLIVAGWVARAYRERVRVLELGCAMGATTKQLADVGFEVYAVDGAPEAIRRAEERLNNYDNVHLCCSSFCDLGKIFRHGFFDLVIDVCALQHNRVEESRAIVDAVQDLMKEGATLWSMMVADGTTRDIYKDLPYTHFATENDVKRIFGNLKPLYVEEYIRSMLTGGTAQSIHWIVCCRKEHPQTSEAKDGDKS